jgi:hypothetical protein
MQKVMGRTIVSAKAPHFTTTSSTLVLLLLAMSTMTREDRQSDDANDSSYAQVRRNGEVSITATSQVPAIWQRFFRHMERIDHLEKQVEEHVSRKRRRLQNLSEQMPSHRRTNVRVFVTHQFDPYTGIWTVVLEGKLLIGNLDHASASKVDKEGVMTVREEVTDDEQEKTQTKKAIADTNTPDRNQYKIQAEEETPVEPVLFTHLFDKLEVSFRTIYQPRTPSIPSYDASFSAKKSRSAKRKTPQPETEAQVNPADLRASPPTKLVWNKHANAASASSQPSTQDAHAFCVRYNNHFSERPPPPDQKFHSIVADIRLYPTRPPIRHGNDANVAPLYHIVHDKFRDAFFAGKYGGGTKEDKKAGGNGVVGQAAVPSYPTDSSQYTVPLENEIQIPLLLSYNEIVMALFRYIQDRDLCDPKDRSLVVCDKVLTDVLGVESVNFGYMKQLLLEKNLIKSVASGPTQNTAAMQYPGHAANQKPPEPVHPVCLTYVMNEKSTSLQVPVGFQEVQEESASNPRRIAPIVQDDPLHSPSVLSFDLDVAVPSLFNYRIRELLLNVKKREFEYTTCRTKARYLLVAAKGNEDVIKTRIEQAISGQGYEAENIPVFLALARAAHPFSEARVAAQIDAKTCDLMERVKETSAKAAAAWEAVEAIQQLVKGGEVDD